MQVGARADRLRSSLQQAGCDVLVVSNLVNIRYLTGFTGSAALLLVAPESLWLLTDGRYAEQAGEELDAVGVGAQVVVSPTSDRQREALAEAAAGAARVGLEADHVTWAAQRVLESKTFPRAELVATSGLVEALRAVKDAGEVARIEAACAIADTALARVAPQLAGRPTEAAFALALEVEMRELGADDISFDTIVAAGANGARPHHSPSAQPVEHGDLVVVDFGALVDGYHSDMTRTIAVGGLGALDPEQRRMLEVVREAQAAGVAAVRSGVDTREVDAACRAAIAQAGWGDAFVHGTGHGVGLDIHEAPRVADGVDDRLVAGHVVTVEPGVYLAGRGGVRIEDTVVVTDEGCRTLTRAPKC